MDQPHLKKKAAKRKCVTSVFEKASRGYFLIWHPVLPKPTALWVETHTFFQFLLGVVVEGRSAPGKIIVCDRLPRPRERPARELALKQLLRHGIFSFLFSPQILALRCILDPVFEVVQTESFCAWERTPPTSHRAELWEMVLLLSDCHTATPRQEGKARSNFNGGKPHLLRQLSTLLKYYTLKNTQDSEIW